MERKLSHVVVSRQRAGVGGLRNPIMAVSPVVPPAQPSSCCLRFVQGRKLSLHPPYLPCRVLQLIGLGHDPLRLPVADDRVARLRLLLLPFSRLRVPDRVPAE